MAVVVASAKYGVGVYGASSYGAVNISFTLTGVTATGAIQPVAINGFEIDISERLGSVFATGSIGTISPNIQEDIVGVAATGAVNGALEFSNTHSISSVSATGTINSVGVGASVGLTGTQGTTAVEAVAAGGFEVDVSEALNSVSATASLGNIQPVVNFVKLAPSLLATGSIGTISPNVKEELGANAVTSVFGTTSVNSVTVHTSAGITTPAITASLGTISKTAVQFDFEAVKNLYSRRRTVTLSRAA